MSQSFQTNDMIQEPTVFILGAGASFHLGYPLGSDLWKEIVEHLSPIKNFLDIPRAIQPKEKQRKKDRELLVKLGFSEKNITEFHDNLKGYGPSTLDEFIENNQGYRELAKFAIAQVLIPYEDAEILTEQQDWYQKLFEKMKTPVEQFFQNKITFISFNIAVLISRRPVHIVEWPSI